MKNTHEPGKDSFKTLIKEVRLNLNGPYRLFSKFFHIDFIEGFYNAIDVIFNPLAMVATLSFTILVEVIILFSSSISDFQLSGSEILVVFTLGYFITSIARIFIFISKGRSI